jgi:hypothetical protein
VGQIWDFAFLSYQKRFVGGSHDENVDRERAVVPSATALAAFCLILIRPDHPSGFRIDQVQPRANRAR